MQQYDNEYQDKVIALLLGRAAFQSEAYGAVIDLRRAILAISDFDSALSMAALNVETGMGHTQTTHNATSMYIGYTYAYTYAI